MAISLVVLGLILKIVVGILSFLCYQVHCRSCFKNLCDILCPGQQYKLSEACCCLYPSKNNPPRYRGQLAITNDENPHHMPSQPLALTHSTQQQSLGAVEGRESWVIHNYFVAPRRAHNPEDHYEMRQLLPSQAEGSGAVITQAAIEN